MLKKILSVGFIIGCMDGMAAIINGFLSFGIMPERIFKYIASGFYGAEAFSGGTGMIVLGILIHFFIATVVTAVFFVLYARIEALQNYHPLYGALYGVLVWLVMNLIVIPLSSTPPSSPGVNQIIIGLLIHIFIIGLPISFFADRYVRKRSM